jgi:hypothetical protein
VCRVEDIGIDELDVRFDPRQEIFMTLLNVLAPELGTLEQLGALRNFATELVSILLFHELNIC